MRTIVAEDAQGQILVVFYESGRVEVARRSKPHYSWSPPMNLIADERPNLVGWGEGIRSDGGQDD